MAQLENNDFELGHNEIVEAAVDPEEIKQSLRSVLLTFLNFFAHDIMDYPTPDFHHRIWRLMTDLTMHWVAIAVPRGHAKTTLAKLAAVWYFLFTDISFIVYVSNTADAAVKAVCDIMDFFDQMNFIKLFGKIEYQVEKRGDGEFIFIIRTPFNGTKECILKARGCGQQLRGLNVKNRRPQLAIVDDLEDIEDLDNEIVRKKNERWFFGTFVKALDRRFRKIMFIGNLIDRNCILKKCIDSPRWYSMVLGAITKNGHPLWQDMWSLNDLIEDYQEYQRLGHSSLWFAEMMNLIVAGDNSIITPEQIVYHDVPDVGVCEYGFLTIDPGTGIGQNKTAIVAHLLLPTETRNHLPLIGDYQFGQFGESMTVDIALSMCFEWGIRIIAIEAVAYQRALATLFEIIMTMRGITGITILKTHPGHSSKSERIRAWAALLIQKAYAIAKGDLHVTNQLLAYDMTKKENDDDLIDACAMGPEVLKQYMGLIMSSKLQQFAASIKVIRDADIA